MEWSPFLILLVTATCCALALWFGIKVGFRNSSEPDSGEQPSQQSPDAEPSLELIMFPHWNFTAVLTVVPLLLLVLGISLQTASFRHPVTGTLTGALILLWGMAFSSRMLSFPRSEPELKTETITSYPEIKLADFKLADFKLPDETSESEERS